MPSTTTAGRLWANSHLPEPLRDERIQLDGKSIAALFERIAAEHPDEYGKVAKGFLDLGKTVAYRTGGYSFGLNALRKPAAATLREERLKPLLAMIRINPKLTDDQKSEKINDLMASEVGNHEKEIYSEEKSKNNPIAMQIQSGSRGKPSSLERSSSEKS